MPLPKAPAHPAEILEDYGTPATPESERKLPDVKIVEEHGGTEYTPLRPSRQASAET